MLGLRGRLRWGMGVRPVVISTWSFGAVANAAAWPVLAGGGSALDAVVAGATAVEDDPAVDSVGVGGLPDASGRVSLDACVMVGPGRCGSVAYLRGYAHAAQVARLVMEKTVHVMLAGDGAEAFAQRQGFVRHPTDLLTLASKSAWEQWRVARDAEDRHGGAGVREGELPAMNVEERYAQARHMPGAREGNHDTVCVLGLDDKGELAGAVTTSGLGYKVPGRVGDSPIVGHGLYVDQQVGAAAATGNGELVMGVCGSFLAVEFMRQGRTPAEAVVGVLERVVGAYEVLPQHQVGVVAMSAGGAWACASLRGGFSCCVTDGGGQRRVESGRVLLG